jgi:hypothetical protein
LLQQLEGLPRIDRLDLDVRVLRMHGEP